MVDAPKHCLRQVMTALPASQHQAWHWDNKSRGLTIIIPLEDFVAENGPTQVLIGSHKQEWPVVMQEGARVIQAPAGMCTLSRLFDPPCQRLLQEASLHMTHGSIIEDSGTRLIGAGQP